MMLRLSFIALFVMHGIEEYATGFHNVDLIIGVLSRSFELSPLAIFLLVQVVTLIAIAILLRYPKAWLVLALLISLLELEHLIRGMMQGGYYPGMVTAVFFPVIGFLILRGRWSSRKE